MLAYYGSRISENQTVTPEGFLICHKVPIARTGYQDYLPEEVGIEGDGIVKVYRSPEEVFSNETLASFEGKPVTLSHPPTLVDTNNGAAYIKGHVQNVVRGEGDESDFIIADLFITDNDLIRRVQGGLREVSCGYEYAIGQEGDRIVQTHIRGNHVAVVENGRAGKQVAIKDEDTVTRWFTPRKKETNERSKSMSKKKNGPSLLGQLFGLVAKDSDPEAVADIAEALMERNETDSETPAPTPAPPATDNPPKEPTSAETTDSPMERICALLEAMNTKLDALNAPKSHDNDPLEALLEKAEQLDNSEEAATVPAIELPEGDEETETKATDEEQASSQVEAAHTVTPTGEQPENPIPGADTLRKDIVTLLKVMKPDMAKLPPKQRRVASDTATRILRNVMGAPARKTVNLYAKVNDRKPAAVALDSNATLAVDNGDLGKSIMARHNPHYRKSGK